MKHLDIKKVFAYTKVALLLAPTTAFAQSEFLVRRQAEARAARGGNTITNFEGLINAILNILRSIVPVIFALAMIYFLWGVVEYVTKAGEEKKEATERIVGGLVALFVMFSVYGLIEIIRGTFPLNESQIRTPQI